METKLRELSPDLATRPRPARPRLGARLAYRGQRLLAPNPAWRRLARWIEATRPGYRLFTVIEKAVKTQLFGCRMCGQCALPVTGYACPMTCPKQLRNGPCGGVGRDGSCEVFPGQRCVWLIAWERAEQQGRADDLRRLQRPIDQRQWGRSSWVNYWSGRDDDLWTEPGPVPAASAPGPGPDHDRPAMRPQAPGHGPSAAPPARPSEDPEGRSGVPAPGHQPRGHPRDPHGPPAAPAGAPPARPCEVFAGVPPAQRTVREAGK